MADHSEKTTYYVRGTDPKTNRQIDFECIGFEMAHAKAAEPRMAAYKDVIMSVSDPTPWLHRIKELPTAKLRAARDCSRAAALKP